MSNIDKHIDKQGLRERAESTISILENIAGFEPSDIDGDTVDFRFETEDGFDTGCDVSIVDQCQKTSDVVRALLDELEAAEKRIAELEARDINIKQQAQALFEAIANPSDHYVPAYARCLREALNGTSTGKGE